MKESASFQVSLPGVSNYGFNPAVTFEEIKEYSVLTGFSFLSRPISLQVVQNLGIYTPGTPGKRSGTAHPGQIRITSFCELIDGSAVRQDSPLSLLDTGDWLREDRAKPMGAEAPGESTQRAGKRPI